MVNVGNNQLRLPLRKQIPDWLAYVLTLTVTWLLIGPRIPIVSVAGSSVRVEDVFLALLWICVLARWRAINEALPRRRVAAIALTALCATIVAVFAGRISPGPGILYSIRPLEYWVIFPALFFCFSRASEAVRSFFPKVLGAITLIQVGVAGLQSLLGLDLGFSKFSTERGAGLTAGPYELGAICSMLAIFWFVRRNYALTLVAALGVFLSASRISILGLAAGAIVAIVASRRSASASRVPKEKRVLAATAALLGLMLAATFVLVNPMSTQQLGSPVISRLQDTSTLDAWVESGKFASGLTLPENSEEYDLLAYGNMPYLLGDGGFSSAVSGEASDMVRFFRWHVLLDLMNSPTTILFGLGPSFAGASVDGSFVRMLAETGILGLFAWLFSIKAWGSRLGPAALGPFIALLVGAVFIDVLYSLRPMILLWSLLAFDDARTALSAPNKVGSGAGAGFENLRDKRYGLEN